MSSAKKRLLLVFTTAMHMTWSGRSCWAFLYSSSRALWVTSMVAVACKSSTVNTMFRFDSLFSAIMQIIFSFVLAGDFNASAMGVAALTSILCRSKRSVRLNLS